METWYFSLDPTVLEGHTMKEWLVNISIFAKRNNKDFKFCETVANHLAKEHKKMLSNNFRHSPAGRGGRSGQNSLEDSKVDGDDDSIDNFGQAALDP